MASLLQPGASIAEYAMQVADLYSLRGKEWANTPILSVFRPEGYYDKGYEDDEREVEWLDENGNVQVSTIRANEHHKVRIVSKTFDKKENSEHNPAWEAQKDDINAILGRLKTEFPRKRQEVVLLDHYSMRTTRTMARCGLKPAQIHVPNPDPDFVKKAGLYASKQATVTCETLFEWANRQDTEDEELVGAFDVLADFCCSWEGNPQCRPTLDLHTIFRKTLLAKSDGILWVTFSLPLFAKGSTADVGKKVKAWLQQEALHFDYCLNFVCERSYGRIVTLIFMTGRKHAQTDFTPFLAGPVAKRYGCKRCGRPGHYAKTCLRNPK